MFLKILSLIALSSFIILCSLIFLIKRDEFTKTQKEKYSKIQKAWVKPVTYSLIILYFLSMVGVRIYDR